MTRPFLIVVTGLPGTGKTELGRYLAGELDVPFIYKDGIKETLFDTLGVGDTGWSHRLGAAAYELIDHILEAVMPVGVPLVLESNFDPDKTGDLRHLVAKHDYAVAQVLLKAEGHTLVERFKARSESGERHPGHVDNMEEMVPRLLKGRIEPVPLDRPIIEVDTTGFDLVDYDSILKSVREAIASQGGDTRQ
jgi:predicted kinase